MIRRGTRLVRTRLDMTTDMPTDVVGFMLSLLEAFGLTNSCGVCATCSASRHKTLS